MIRYKRWLVALDLTETDKVLVDQVKDLAEVLKPQKIYFLHVLKSMYVPRDMLQDYADAFTPADEEVERNMRDSYAKLFTDETELDFKAVEGSRQKEIIHYAYTKNIDLVIAGRKKSEEGKGILPKLLSRKVPGSSLFIPPKTKDGISPVLVPTDFSEYSLEAANDAIELAKRSGNDQEIVFQHIYYVPTGYYKTGKSFEEFAEIMKGHAKKDAEQFLDKLNFDGIKYRVIYTLEEKKLAKHIMDAAKEINAGFIVIGAKGRTDAAAVLLGSITERLGDYNLEYPQLIVRKKGEKLDFAEAIKNL